ncbi:T9SS type A sorting domain-containing protein [Flavobacterium hungaricum]|uniref:T9SS C-terminal target domain-containing protein n=1 Tax=Flavobacterium hungaricum TaxID=2082725 RepID=A0ABR9TM13_9FLAO|nr:T9SS type A sorting domain-containing protein [Flavobacterium hungaricum]MBE8726403.1 T9SS C-terminal target domain-containing protein [Flavobacterium hungaricum]
MKKKLLLLIFLFEITALLHTSNASPLPSSGAPLPSSARQSSGLLPYALTPSAEGILYVRKGAAGNGSSWANAAGELADALQEAAGNAAIKQIWAAGGTYYPKYAADFASTDGRDKSFVLVKDVKLYGGFAGTETELAERNLGLDANKTILSGDLGAADDYTDNSYHVVIASGDMGSAALDGFTIMKGCSATGSETNRLAVNGNNIMRIAGGGIILYSASPAVTNVIICGNQAIAGAGIYFYSSSTRMTNCLITGNNANVSGTGNGGGSFAYSSSPVFVNSVLAGNNAAGWGGAFVVSSSTFTFYNSIIYGNGTSQPAWIISGSYSMQYSMLQGAAENTASHNPASTDPLFINSIPYSLAPFTSGNYALAFNSPLINKGSNSLYSGLDSASRDLVGNPRVSDYAGSGIIDMGAYEFQELPLSVSPGLQADITCNGGNNGSASVAVAGGTKPYMYSWDTTPVQTAATASGLKAGTYTVTVTDARHTALTQSFTITEPPVLAVTPSQNDVSCNGGNNGSAAVSVTGGTGAYSYSWNTTPVQTAATASGLKAGTYTVTITDANSCSAVQTFTITEPPVLAVTQSQTNVSCNGGNNGSAAVTVTGGTGAYSYSWNTTPVQTAATASGLKAGTYTVTITDANSCSAVQSFTITEPPLLAVTPSQTDVSCNGGNNGSAAVSVTGGTGAYSYSWNTTPVQTAATASGLKAGTYTVTITDANNCSAVQPFTITEPPVLVVTPSQTNVSCNGGNNGSAAVSVTGGSGGYTYAWDTAPSQSTAAATGLSAGTYIVTVTDANLCSKTQSFTIAEPDALTASASKTDVSCNGGSNGSATVSVTGGTGTYTYAWSPSGGTNETASGLSAGTYTVLIKDSNLCETTASVTIAEPALLTATIEKTDVLCNQANNGTATVIPSGGTGTYTYSWSPSGGTAATAAGLSPNTYSVTVTDANGCFVTASVQITEPAPLSAADTQTNVSCKGGNDGTASVAASGGTGNYSYLWAPSGGTAATATGLTAGTYTVTITDENSCSLTNTILITEPDTLKLTATVEEVSCYKGNNGSATVNVTGGTGSYTYSWAPSGGTAATATGLAAGTYTVTVTDENSCSITNTILITEPDVLNLTAALTEVSCYNGNNGSATVSVTGGTGSYTYSWAPSGGTAATATGLTAGTYTVTVTDGNFCTASAAVEILQPANPVTLNTGSVAGITANGASLSGTASSDGINTDSGSCLTEVGFVYAQHANPTTADTKINISAALGTFTNSLSGLRGNRTYYVRTYAINSNGFVNYGNEVSFTTQKYTLTITAAAGHTKVYGTEDPAFNYTPLGFANGDTPSIITGLLSRDAGENVGKYNIKLGSISAGADYTIAFTGAEFEITKADQTITWNQTLEFGCIDSNNVTLTAAADSGLPVSYTISNAALGTISGSTLNITGSGSSTITAVQNGDQNHNAAASAVKPIEVSRSGLVTQHWANVLFFDNKSNNYEAWQWYKNGTAVSGATRQYYSEVQPLNGSYYVIAKDKNGNSIKSCPIETTGTVFTSKIKIYPNPVKPGAEFTLECDFSDSQLNESEVVIYDITGKLVQTISNVKAKNEIIAPSQAAVYVVVLKLADGQLKTINLLVK